MTPADISEQAAKAAMECDAEGHDVGEYMCGACAIVLGRRLIAIGRAEAYEESAEDVLKYKRKHGWPEQWAQWLRARAAEERKKC